MTESLNEAASRIYQEAFNSAPGAVRKAPATPPLVLDFARRLAAYLAEGQEPWEIEYPEYHRQGMGCGLEDRSIHDRYEAMEYGWQCAIDAMAERIPEELYLHPAPKQEPVALVRVGAMDHGPFVCEVLPHGIDTLLDGKTFLYAGPAPKQEAPEDYDLGYQQGKGDARESLDRLNTALRQSDARYMKLLQKVADGIALQPPAPIHLHTQQVPEGYALVPIEPTQEMYDAADRPQEISLIWKAMIAAAKEE